jgi:hypothetical protein
MVWLERSKSRRHRQPRPTSFLQWLWKHLMYRSRSENDLPEARLVLLAHILKFLAGHFFHRSSRTTTLAMGVIPPFCVTYLSIHAADCWQKRRCSLARKERWGDCFPCWNVARDVTTHDKCFLRRLCKPGLMLDRLALLRPSRGAYRTSRKDCKVEVGRNRNGEFACAHNQQTLDGTGFIASTTGCKRDGPIS